MKLFQATFRTSPKYLELLSSLPIEDGKLHYDTATMKTHFVVKLFDKRSLRFSMSDYENMQYRHFLKTFKHHLNLALLERRRELVARQNEVGQGYW